jgi:hypothetical protein
VQKSVAHPFVSSLFHQIGKPVQRMVVTLSDRHPRS